MKQVLHSMGISKRNWKLAGVSNDVLDRREVTNVQDINGLDLNKNILGAKIHRNLSHIHKVMTLCVN